MTTDGQFEINLQEARRRHDRHHELEDQLNEGAYKSAALALQTLIAINGGAIVALLALIGSSKFAEHPKALLGTLSSFAWGLSVAVLSMGLIFGAYYLGVLSSTRAAKKYEHPYIERSVRSKQLRRFALISISLSFVLGLWSFALFVTGGKRGAGDRARFALIAVGRGL